MVHGARFLLRGLPADAIDPRGLVPVVFRHPFDGKGFAAERVGEQMLQGTYLTPSSRLHRLHHTRLEPPHRAVHGVPIDGMPCGAVVGKCTSPCRHGRHLPSLLKRCAKLSGDERPDGRLPAFAWGDVASGSTPIPPVTGGPSLLPSSLARISMRAPYGFLSLAGEIRGYHVPHEYHG